MVGVNVKTKTNGRGVRRALRACNFKSLKAAAAYVWKAAVNSVKRVPSNEEFIAAMDSGDEKKMRSVVNKRKRRSKPSKPGKPPHSQTGLFPKSIAFDVNEEKQSAVIGPRESIIGPIGRVMEGGDPDFRGGNYPARPTMRPARDRSLKRLPKPWASALKGK